jgi:hypothetical protein
MKPLEPEDIDIPVGRALNIAHAHRHVVNSFELHEAEFTELLGSSKRNALQ